MSLESKKASRSQNKCDIRSEIRPFWSLCINYRKAKAHNENLVAIKRSNGLSTSALDIS